MGARILKKALQRISAQASAEKRYVIDFLSKLVYVSLLVLGVITGLGTLGANITALVTSLGLTGVAFSFAFKDIIANALAGILLMLFRPIKIDDHITVTEQNGRVTDIDLRYTTLHKVDKTILIPNATLFTNTIIIDKSPQ